MAMVNVVLEAAYRRT